ncbi:diguanylate cyclase domain-containing protein [Egicoccus sp. AB-alg6-2]|uniref:diguanylate cyclase domain-containing protein n=1 Tax=Egicoccus sp. AB-alg6-2 TaxID=3242692 RepID=UPI00359DD766
MRATQIDALVAAVVLTGVGVFAASVVLTRPAPPTGVALGGLVVFGVLFLLAECFPIRLFNGRDVGEFCSSPAFAYALLLTLPFPYAIGVIGVGTLLAECRPTVRRPWRKAAFNVGQSVLVFAAGAAVLKAFGIPAAPDGVLADAVVLALLPSGLALYGTNLALLGLAVAVDRGQRVRTVLRGALSGRDLVAQYLLIGLAPVMVLLWRENRLLLPFLLLTVGATIQATGAAIRRRHEAYHDPLTGLANRRLLDERLAALTTRGRRGFAAMLMDLDDFKRVNDELGHHVGDQLLVQAGRRLRRIAGIDTIARAGGDEFAFVLRRSDAVRARRIAGEIVAAVTAPYDIGGGSVRIGASLGIALFPDHGDDASSLMRQADAAMYRAKRLDGTDRPASPRIAFAADEPVAAGGTATP